MLFAENQFAADKIVYIVRNPIDVFPSFASLSYLRSHAMMPAKPWSHYAEFWDKWITFMSTKMQNYHTWVEMVSKQVPTHFLRFEDLRIDPEPVLKALFTFLLDVESLDGTVLEARIK